MKDIIQYGKSSIKYAVEFADRKTLRIQVHPDSKVKVIAPLKTPVKKIQEKVKSKARWIRKQQDFFVSFHPLTPPRKYVSGETHLYLGRQYRLRIIKSSKESVKLTKGYFIINTPESKDGSHIKSLLRNWYDVKAEYHFGNLFEELKSLKNSFTDQEVNLKKRWMKKRWGSCNLNGQITLNTELIKASKKCIEYVIIHELCHLGFLNHSKSFYNLLEKKLPNWKKVKYDLEHCMV